MSRVEEIEKSVQALSPEELATFREWFARFDERAWDEKFERDASPRKMNAPAGFKDECHRQFRLLQGDPQEAEVLDWIDCAANTEG